MEETAHFPPSSYCSMAGHPVHGPYHDLEYGYPVREEDRLFERLVLEINQAGLSWLTILRKREGFLRAYEGFSVDRVADYGDSDRARLLGDTGIIRNRLKIDAAIGNAKAIREIRGEYGSFASWLDAHHPRKLDQWTWLFREVFRFTGPEIVREFLVSTGYLPGAHDPGCTVYRRIAVLEPPWVRAV